MCGKVNVIQVRNDQDPVTEDSVSAAPVAMALYSPDSGGPNTVGVGLLWYRGVALLNNEP